jgi:hypothetical protein
VSSAKSPALHADGASLTVCVDPGADHGGIVGSKPDHVADWIAARTLSSPEPTACTDDEQAIVDESGMPATCNPLPPND